MGFRLIEIMSPLQIKSGDSRSVVDPAHRTVPRHKLAVVDLAAAPLDFLHQPVQVATGVDLVQARAFDK